MDKFNLCFYSSAHIETFVTQHPIRWHDLALSRRGGNGDIAGATPTPAVQEFFTLLEGRRTLFTQREFTEHCLGAWQSWFGRLPGEQQRGVIAKLYNNFYPSLIDTLHVYALLVEECVGEVYLVSARMDTQDKIDLVLQIRGQVVGIALVGPSLEAFNDRHYKLVHRPGRGNIPVIQVQLPLSRPKTPGNKRWYRVQDFASLWEIKTKNVPAIANLK